jgi:GDP-L-fucose synthase
MKQTILLTGGTGFIGRNIVESSIKDDFNILSPTRKELDLTSLISVKKYSQYNRYDIIIHSATHPAHRNALSPEIAWMENFKMFEGVKILKKFPSTKLINIGTGGVYSKFPAVVGNENYTYPKEQSMFQKFIASREVHAIYNACDIKVFGIYGKYEDFEIRFISNMISKAIFGVPLTIKQNRLMSYIHTDDLIFILKHILSDKYEWNGFYREVSGSREPITLGNIAKKILDTVECDDLPIVFEKNGMGTDYYANIEPTFSIPFKPLEEGIKEVWSYLRSALVIGDRDKLLVNK